MHTELNNGTLHISGDVTVKTLTAAAFTRFRQQCRLKDTRAVDLSGASDAAQ
ncbi:sulfate transporter, partial [Neisseria meningitidis]|nr:sulfate transporter [Neisseria meningitidis]